MEPFSSDRPGLQRALEQLLDPPQGTGAEIPVEAPVEGLGPDATIDLLAPHVLGHGSRNLKAPGFFAHMDPPTPWITWAMSQWTASQNQNLLHPDLSPTATSIERTVVSWLAPLFGMDGGHMTPGSTIANLTAIWAAREAGATEVVCSPSAHLSAKKSAHLLGMKFRLVDWDEPGDLSDAVAVITAGATSTGEIEPLDSAPDARWRHVDAAWAGPLVLSSRHAPLLDGIETADSVSVSAHKWMFQPKESALVFFAKTEDSHRSISVDGEYLAVPNVGVLGSHGATAVPLAATILAYGLNGIAGWIDHTMGLADTLHVLVTEHPDLEARSTPQAGVLNWRRIDRADVDLQVLGDQRVFVSKTTIDGEPWLRSVAANPMADPGFVVDAVANL